MELSISSVEAQLYKYYTLLKQHFNEHEDAVTYMTKYLQSNYPYELKTHVYDDRPEHLPNGTMIRIFIGQWVRIARLHLKDVENMKKHLGMLRRAPRIPEQSLGKEQETFRKIPVATDTMYIETYNGPSEFTLTKSDFEGEDAYHVVEAMPLVQASSRPQRSPIVDPTTTTTPRPTTSGPTPPNSRGKWYGVDNDGFFTGPLTAEAMDDMTLVKPREWREVLGAIALPLAIAATAMGTFDTTQIEALKLELFDLKENTDRLFEVPGLHQEHACHRGHL